MTDIRKVHRVKSQGQDPIEVFNYRGVKLGMIEDPRPFQSSNGLEIGKLQEFLISEKKFAEDSVFIPDEDYLDCLSHVPCAVVSVSREVAMQNMGNPDDIKFSYGVEVSKESVSISDLKAYAQKYDFCGFSMEVPNAFGHFYSMPQDHISMILGGKEHERTASYSMKVISFCDKAPFTEEIEFIGQVIGVYSPNAENIFKPTATRPSTSSKGISL